MKCFNYKNVFLYKLIFGMNAINILVVISLGNARKFSGVLSNAPSFLFYGFKHLQRLIFVYVVRIRTCVSSNTYMRILVYFRFPVIWLVLCYLLMVRFS